MRKQSLSISQHFSSLSLSLSLSLSDERIRRPYLLDDVRKARPSPRNSKYSLSLSYIHIYSHIPSTYAFSLYFFSHFLLSPCYFSLLLTHSFTLSLFSFSLSPFHTHTHIRTRTRSLTSHFLLGPRKRVGRGVRRFV